MRSAALIGASAVAVALVLGFTVLGGAPAKAAKPSLRVVSKAPLTVRGEHFRAGEQVRLSAGKAGARTKANGNGYFVATIPSADPCSTVRVLAQGSEGSYAVVKYLPSRECMPARSG